jgi:hypothetical protein
LAIIAFKQNNEFIEKVVDNNRTELEIIRFAIIVPEEDDKAFIISENKNTPKLRL